MNPQRLILERLALSHPHMTAEAVLWSELTSMGYKLSLTDLRQHVKALESKNQAIVIATEDFTRIKITADGLARLAE